jgi:isomaltose glucohydrolase
MATDGELRQLAQRSVEIIAEHQDVGGAYPASPTFLVYRYSWFRDGSFIADAMSRAGAAESADRFFGWCASVLNDRADHVGRLVERARRGEPIGRDEHLPTRYTLSGADVDEDWWDFQLDGYGAWMWALDAHLRRHHRRHDSVAPAIRAAIAVCAEYLTTFWDQPCYDWWEEHADGIHPSTLASIHAGLIAVGTTELATEELSERCGHTASMIRHRILTDGVRDGHLVKMVGDDRVDASLIACCTPFRAVDPAGPIAEATYHQILHDLAPDGVHRYLGDTFFGGGRWVVLAGFVGWHEVGTGRTDAARARLEWMYDHATSVGHLPEQVVEHCFDPTRVEVWVDKWGPVATPLLWSHAMYLILADELGLLESHD